MDYKYRKLGKNTILVFIGQAGSSLISLLMLPLYTSWLTTEEYGIVDLMSTYATILLSIVTCCVADAIFIFPKGAPRDDKSKYFSSGLLFSLLTTTLFFLLNCVFGYLYKKGSFLQTYSWITLVLMFSMFIQRYFQQFTRSLENMKVFATTGVVYTIAVAVLAIILIPYFHLKGYIYSLIMANIVAALFSFFLSKSYQYFSFHISKSHLRTLLAYSLPLIPNSIMWWLVNGMNRPLMEASLGMSAIGLFAVANKFPGIISMITTVFANAWGISMLDEFEKPGFSSFFNKIFKLITFISVITSLLIIIFSKEVIGLFASESFLDAWHLLPLLVIGAVLNTSAGLIGGVFMASKKSKYFFYSSAAGALTSLALTHILIRYLGLIGCALAVCISFLVAFVLRICFAWKYIKGFSITYYGYMVMVLLLAYFITESDILAINKILIYLSLIVTMVLTNKDIIRPLFNIIKKR